MFHPDYELEAYRALAAAFPQDSLRFDPNGVWSTEQAIRFGQAIEGLKNDYLEDPVFGLNGMRRTREMVRVPLATNTVVVNFEQLAANVLNTAVDVILLDTTFWGGIRTCVKAAGSARRSSWALRCTLPENWEFSSRRCCISEPCLPNLSFAADAHYHQLTDDIIEGGLMKYENGAIRVPTGPGLGVKLNRDKLRQYAELYKKLGNYPYDQDPGASGLDAADSERPLGRSEGCPSGFDTLLIWPIFWTFGSRHRADGQHVGSWTSARHGTGSRWRDRYSVRPPRGANCRLSAARSIRQGTGLCAGRRMFETGTSIDALRDAVLEKFGRIDVLVNAAGVTFKQPTVSMSEEQWLALDGYRSHRCVARLPVVLRTSEGKRPRADHQYRVAGFVSGLLSGGGVCAAKTAVLSLTRSLACEWAKDGICVNAIVPGCFSNGPE